MMKTILAVLLFASPVFAQDDAAAARAAAGCGPDQIKFDVKTDKNQHPAAQPELGKALIYVFEFQKRDPNVNYFGSETTKVGLDGSWVGANHGQSYFFFPVDPGDHHLCANWQSLVKKYSKLGSAVSFNAEAGKVYYFRASVDVRAKYEPSVKLEPLDPAEAQFLISSSALSVSHPKK
jgi:hypothetical protein